MDSNSIHNNNDSNDTKTNKVVTWKKTNESGLIIFEKMRMDPNENNNNQNDNVDYNDSNEVDDDVVVVDDDDNVVVVENDIDSVDNKEKKKKKKNNINNNNRINYCQHQDNNDNDHNEQIIQEEMYNQFEENGYIICRNVFNPKHMLNEWNVSFTTPYNWKRNRTKTNNCHRKTCDDSDENNDDHDDDDDKHNDTSNEDKEYNCIYSLSDYMELFYDIFHYLYQRKYISFPFDRRCCDHDNNTNEQIMTTSTINDVVSSSTTTLDSCHNTKQKSAATTTGTTTKIKTTIEYSLGIGIKKGFYEIVMRSYGRYEISLLNLVNRQQQRQMQKQQNQNHDAATTTNPQRSRSQSDAMYNNNNDYLYQCFPFLHEIQKELFFIPSLLQSKQLQQNNTQQPNSGSNNKENNWNADDKKEIIIKKWTWDDVRIIHMSFIISTPGSVDQAWHSDGGHIDLLKHLNCHVLNIFIPIINMISNDIGLTELRPKSHYYTRDLMKLLLLAKIKKQIVSSITPYLYIGDILIFDYRILHRGKANKTIDTNRTYLVITVAQSWFHDTLNFPSNSIFD